MAVFTRRPGPRWPVRGIAGWPAFSPARAPRARAAGLSPASAGGPAHRRRADRRSGVAGDGSVPRAGWRPGVPGRGCHRSRRGDIESKPPPPQGKAGPGPPGGRPGLPQRPRLSSPAGVSPKGFAGPRISPFAASQTSQGRDASFPAGPMDQPLRGQEDTFFASSCLRVFVLRVFALLRTFVVQHSLHPQASSIVVPYGRSSLLQHISLIQPQACSGRQVLGG